MGDDMKEAGASYREGVRWIALNDEPDELDIESVSGYTSTLLLADLFDKDPVSVAASVVHVRTSDGE